jgi:hypothetical protein
LTTGRAEPGPWADRASVTIGEMAEIPLRDRQTQLLRDELVRQLRLELDIATGDQAEEAIRTYEQAIQAIGSRWEELARYLGLAASGSGSWMLTCRPRRPAGERMTDLGGAVLFETAALGVTVLISAGMFVAHADAGSPGRLRRVLLPEGQKHLGRRALLVEIPVLAWLVVVGQLVCLDFLAHPNSTVPVRLVALLEVGAFVAWTVYLLRLMAKGSRGRRRTRRVDDE